jgi:hypothetical protein
MSVIKLEGVTIPGAKKKRKYKKGEERYGTQFKVVVPKEGEGKIEKDNGLFKSIRVYDTSKGKIKIQIKDGAGNSYIHPFSFSKKKTPYAKFTKKEFDKWKMDHPGEKADLPKLSKEIAKKWKTSPEKGFADTTRAIKTMERKRG